MAGIYRSGVAWGSRRARVKPSGYWLVSSSAFDAPVQVEHFETLDEAFAKFKARMVGEAFCVEVYSAEGSLILHQDMDTWQMSEPQQVGSFTWSEKQGFQRIL